MEVVSIYELVRLYLMKKGYRYVGHCEAEGYPDGDVKFICRVVPDQPVFAEYDVSVIVTWAKPWELEEA